MSKILERLHHVDKKKDDAPVFSRPQNDKKNPQPRKKVQIPWGVLLIFLGVLGVFMSVYHLVDVQLRNKKSEIRAVKTRKSENDFKTQYAALVKDIAAKKNEKTFDPSIEKSLREWSFERPEETRIAVTLAFVLKKTGKLEEAKKTLEMAVVFDRADALAWNNLGMVYAELGQYEKSVEALRQSLAIEKNGEVLLNLAFAYEQISDFKSSQETLGQYLATFAPKDKLKSTLSNRMRVLGSLAYLQATPEPPSSGVAPALSSPSAEPLRGPASKGGK